MQHPAEQRPYRATDEQGGRKNTTDGSRTYRRRSSGNLREQDRHQPPAKQLATEDTADDAIAVAPHLRDENGNQADNEATDAQLPIQRQAETDETAFSEIEQPQKRRGKMPQ